MNLDYLIAGSLFTLIPNISVAASGNGTGVDISNCEGDMLVILDVGAATAGSSPTMDIKLQSSADNSTNWTDVPSGAFTQATGASLQKLAIHPRNLNKYLRAVKTIGGTSSPAFPVACHGIALKKV